MKRARAKMEARKGRVKELMSGRLRHPSSGAASFKQFRLRKRAAANRPRRAALATERRAQPYHRVRVRQFACSVRSNPSITNLEIDTQTVKFEQSFLQKTRSPQNEWGYAIAVQRLAASHLFVRRHPAGYPGNQLRSAKCSWPARFSTELTDFVFSSSLLLFPKYRTR